MAGLLNADKTPAEPTLPRGRSRRRQLLLAATERELTERPELWAQNESLAGAQLANPELSPLAFAGEPKCNIFIGEMLYRAGFVPPGTPAPGQRRVAYPSVNQMVARAQRLAAGAPWSAADGVQWFDIVDKEMVESGDIVLIAAADRGDHLQTDHGHVEIVRHVEYLSGSILRISTIGARSAGIKLEPTVGRIFRSQQINDVFNQFAVVVRPRMR
jgi:hypothetical protein